MVATASRAEMVFFIARSLLQMASGSDAVSRGYAHAVFQADCLT
jgi:hypothetical protein